jgi:hypothetical protein
MPKNKQPMHTTLGFDPEVLVPDLIARLVATRSVDTNDPRVLAWSSPPKDADRVRYVLSLGMEHLAQHGIQREGFRCTRIRCEAAGLSASITEIAGYLLEREDVTAVLSDELDKFWLQPTRFMSALRVFIGFNQTHMGGSPTINTVREVLKHLKAATEALAPLQQDLLSQLESPQFRQAGNGPPALRLLKAVYQHLHLTGGYSHTELGRFPLNDFDRSMINGDSAAVEDYLALKVDNIKKHLRSPDQRTWHPYVPKASQEASAPPSLLP